MTLSVFDFRDPGDFLKASYQALKETDPGVSHRYISASLGFRSPAIFCQIISGRIKPSAKTIDGLARLFRLDAMERDFLAHLFMLRTIDDDRLKTLVLAGFRSGRGIGAEAFSNR
jgi:hypothetical protein